MHSVVKQERCPVHLLAAGPMQTWGAVLVFKLLVSGLQAGECFECRDDHDQYPHDHGCSTLTDKGSLLRQALEALKG